MLVRHVRRQCLTYCLQALEPTLATKCIACMPTYLEYCIHHICCITCFSSRRSSIQHPASSIQQPATSNQQPATTYCLLSCTNEGPAHQLSDGLGVGSGHLLELLHQAAHFAPQIGNAGILLVAEALCLPHCLVACLQPKI